MEDILKAIPHREPFLFVDKVLEQTDTYIRTQKMADPDAPFFKGHFPDYPIMPGVLVCEAVFQAGAILMSGLIHADKKGGVPVITRIKNVKFKNAVFPGDMLEIYVERGESAGQAYYMKGKVTVGSKTILTLEFAAMLTEALK